MNEISNKSCVVGAGHWGKNYLKTLSQLNINFSVVEQDKKTRALLKDQYSNIKFYNNIDETFEQDYDSYFIITPPHTHYDLALKCLENNKNVLIEKPLTLIPKDAKQLYKVAKEKKKTLAVGHLLLFHPAVRLIKKYIQDGYIGEIKYIYSNRLNLGTVRTKEDVIWSLAPHDISVIQFLVDSFPNKIETISQALVNRNINDIATIFLDYADKKIKSHIFVNWLNPIKDHSLTIIGNKRMITLNGVSNELTVHHKFLNEKNVFLHSQDISVQKIDYEFDYPLTLQIKHFLNNQNNPNIKYIGGKEAIDVMNILHDASSQLL